MPGDFVAIGDAHQRVGAMGVDHVLHGVGNEFAGGQAVEHAAMTHGDAVIDSNRVELAGNATGFFNGVGDGFADIAQMNMTWHELRERIGNRDHGLAKVAVF